MKPTVYLETSIISYLSARISRDLVVAGRQQITRNWWDSQMPNFSLFVSEFVLTESAEGDKTAAQKRLDILRLLSVLSTTREALDLANRFVSHKCIPKSAGIDALHVAVATVNGMDFLMTWNCTHIANATLRSHLALEADLAGYHLPVICTPEELFGGKHVHL
jgi:hypothetical protein